MDGRDLRLAVDGNFQAGWAKCEKRPGVYDWAWLDEVVNDAVAQGVEPWLETSYGNTIYPGGGGTGLAGGLPHSPEALAAWDRGGLPGSAARICDAREPSNRPR